MPYAPSDVSARRMDDPHQPHITRTGDVSGDTNPFKTIGRGLSSAYNWLTSGNGLNRADNEFRDIDPSGRLADWSKYANRVGRVGINSFGQLGVRGNQALDQLQRLANGQDSFSAEQLRQAAGRNVAMQQGIAAGASPQNAAMAARMAAQNSANINTSLAGQQALAGIQERNAAANAYMQGIQGLRGQDLQEGLGGLGLGLQGQQGIENARTQKFQAMTQTPAKAESIISGITGGLKSVLSSDGTLKIDLRADPEAADRLIKALSPKSFEYANGEEKEGEPGMPIANGGAKRLGVVAQEVEKTPEGKALVEKLGGKKTLDVPQLAGASAAMIGRLGERMDKLESLVSKLKGAR